MKMRIYPSFFFIIIIAIMGILVFFYLRYFRKKEHTFYSLKAYLSVFFYLFGIVLFLLLFAVEIIELWFIGGVSEMENWLFTIATGFTFGMFLCACGLVMKEKKLTVKILIVITFAWFSLSGFGYFGIRIVFNTPVSDYLFYNTFQTNSSHGIFFFMINFIQVWLLVYFAALITMAEARN